MCLWSVALKARKAAKWPRTFYMVWTVSYTKSIYYNVEGIESCWLVIGLSWGDFHFLTGNASWRC